MKNVVALANRANVSVYALDSRGVAGRLGDNIEAGAVTADVLLAEERRSQQILEDLAASTDGRSFVKTSNFAGAFDTIKAESSTYYLLSYKRPETNRKGYHRIEVQVNRPGITVRARKGYDDRLPLSLPASATPALAPQTAPPTREPGRMAGRPPENPSQRDIPPTRETTQPVSAPGNPAVAPGVLAELRSQPPTYLVLIDTESFDEDQARKACAVAGAFVDGLDPDDRVAILSVASGTGQVEASRDRLAAGASLASIVETVAARPSAGAKAA